MPLQATSGAASYDAFGGGAAAVPNYIEDVFSTYLYTGNATARSIVNDIDLSTKGGLVWFKNRSADNYHLLFDTARGVGKEIYTNTTDAEGGPYSPNQTLQSFNSNGFTIGTNSSMNGNGSNIVSWTFREQPKFFDVVTYSGNSVNGRTISHGLGSVPGFIIIKSTTASSNWTCYHRSIGATNFVKLNATDASDVGPFFNDTTPTSTQFTVSGDFAVNQSGETYVAYVFAHDAGGFGLTGTDNVISCGTFTSTAGGAYSEVSLGYEPQWVLIKTTSTTNDWMLFDNMRGMTASLGGGALLTPNSSAQEFGGYSRVIPTATGFYGASGLNASADYIYIAIRRGPMKVPTSGTSVFAPVAQTNTGSQPFPVTAGFPVDSAWFGQRNGWGVNFITSDRLRGATNLLLTTSTNSEATNNSTYGPSVSKLDSNTQFFDGMTNASEPDIYWMFRRAPSFFDEVCYTGTGVTTNFTHNLGVVPEMLITKKRSNTGPWVVYTAMTGNTDYLQLYTADAVQTNTDYYNSTTPTASVFTLGSSTSTNTSSQTYVAYLFATCAGVSKVGSYTGTGTTNQINCGFTSGARFVLIKRTDNYNLAVGDWYVWDSARGIVSGNDPYLLINSTAAEVTSTDYVDTYSAGFEISSTAPNALNQSGANYIFLAIA
jgi:hypothetical protein